MGCYIYRLSHGEHSWPIDYVYHVLRQYTPRFHKYQIVMKGLPKHAALCSMRFNTFSPEFSVQRGWRESQTLLQYGRQCARMERLPVIAAVSNKPLPKVPSVPTVHPKSRQFRAESIWWCQLQTADSTIQPRNYIAIPPVFRNSNSMLRSSM